MAKRIAYGRRGRKAKKGFRGSGATTAAAQKAVSPDELSARSQDTRWRTPPPVSGRVGSVHVRDSLPRTSTRERQETRDWRLVCSCHSHGCPIRYLDRAGRPIREFSRAITRRGDGQL